MGRDVGHGGARDPGLSVAVSRPRNQRRRQIIFGPTRTLCSPRQRDPLSGPESPRLYYVSRRGLFLCPGASQGMPGLPRPGLGQGDARPIALANRRSPHRSSTITHLTARSLALAGRAPPLPASPPWRRPLSPLVNRQSEPPSNRHARHWPRQSLKTLGFGRVAVALSRRVPATLTIADECRIRGNP